MPGVVSLASLLIQETQANILATALGIASAIGLPVTSWQPGDPTRSLYIVEATKLQALEATVCGFISSGFLGYATGDWLTILAQQVFNVTVPQATYATGNCTLTNTGGGYYEIAAGDLSVLNSTTGATFHNTSGGTLVPLTGTLSLAFEADVAGSGGNSAATEIDTIVTTLLGVTISNPLAFVGQDQQDEASTIQQCQDKLGSLSPNGPAEAYSYVARTPSLSGTSNITKVRTYPDSDTGDVPVFLAGASGGASSPDVALVAAAIAQWATPLCITPTVSAANNVPVNVTYTLWIYNSVNQTSTQIEAAIASALEDLFASPQFNPIGGNIIPPSSTGYLFQTQIVEAIGATFPQILNLTLAAPSTDVSLGNGDIATLGTVTPTINFVADPK